MTFISYVVNVVKKSFIYQTILYVTCFSLDYKYHASSIKDYLTNVKFKIQICD